MLFSYRHFSKYLICALQSKRIWNSEKQKHMWAPDLHALAAGAQVFPEQDAVDGR